MITPVSHTLLTVSLHYQRKFNTGRHVLLLKARCWEPPGHYLCTPEPGRPGCVISIEKDVKPANATSAEKRLWRKWSFPLYISPRRCLTPCYFAIIHMKYHIKMSLLAPHAFLGMLPYYYITPKPADKTVWAKFHKKRGNECRGLSRYLSFSNNPSKFDVCLRCSRRDITKVDLYIFERAGSISLLLPTILYGRVLQ